MKVYIDIGHGGRDPGAVSTPLVEREMTIVTALALAERLKQHGYEVMIEPGVLEIDASARRATSWGADLLVSCHYNAGGGARGEVIHSIRPGSEKLAAAVAAGLKAAGQTNVRIYSKLNSAGNSDYFGILRNSRMSAVIVEPCFIDSADRQLADTEAEQKHIGYCIADAIAHAYGSTLGEEEDSEVRYKKLKDIPNENGFRDVIEKLMDAGIINGDGSDQAGNDDVIDLSHDQVRSLIFEFRGGAFDRRLMACGLDPVVNI